MPDIQNVTFKNNIYRNCKIKNKTGSVHSNTQVGYFGLSQNKTKQNKIKKLKKKKKKKYIYIYIKYN